MFNDLNENDLIENLNEIDLSENDSNENDSTDPNSRAFFIKIISFLQIIIDSCKGIIKYIKDKDKKGLELELSIDRDNLETNFEYNEENRNNLNNLNNLNIDNSCFKISDEVKVKIKMIKRKIINENQDINYELVFDDQGVYYKKRHELFGKKQITNGNYQTGKIIEFENEKTKKTLLAIIIRNTDKESEMLLSYIDLIKDISTYIPYSPKIPPIKDFTFHILDKNDKKQIIIFSICEEKIYVIIFEFKDSDNIDLKNCDKVKFYITIPNFNPISICPIRIFRKDDQIFEKYKVFSKYFLVSSQTNIKLFKYTKEGKIIFICDVLFENEEYNNILAERKLIYRIEQLDNGVITIHIKNKRIINGYLFLDEQK